MKKMTRLILALMFVTITQSFANEGGKEGGSAGMGGGGLDFITELRQENPGASDCELSQIAREELSEEGNLFILNTEVLEQIKQLEKNCSL